MSDYKDYRDLIKLKDEGKIHHLILTDRFKYKGKEMAEFSYYDIQTGYEEGGMPKVSIVDITNM